MIVPSVVCVLTVWFSWIVVFAAKVGGVVITGWLVALGLGLLLGGLGGLVGCIAYVY